MATLVEVVLSWTPTCLVLCWGPGSCSADRQAIDEAPGKLSFPPHGGSLWFAQHCWVFSTGDRKPVARVTAFLDHLPPSPCAGSWRQCTVCWGPLSSSSLHASTVARETHVRCMFERVVSMGVFLRQIDHLQHRVPCAWMSGGAAQVHPGAGKSTDGTRVVFLTTNRAQAGWSGGGGGNPS